MIEVGKTATFAKRYPPPTMIRKLLSACLMSALLAGLPVARSAIAQSHQRIAAVVNEDIISAHDLNARLSLLLATSNLENRAEVRQRLAPEALRMLIDDVLKRQEARRLNVVVTKDETDRALAQIARQMNLKPEDLPAYLEARGVNMATLIEQVQTDIAWVKTIGRLDRDRYMISQDEIEEELARIRENAGKPEYRVAEIFLPIDESADEVEVRQLAERLVEQMRSGANFAALARNFSQGASAAVGGDLGWVRRGDLDPELDAALERMQPGQVSMPLRTQSGYHILALLDRRMSQGVPGTKVTVNLQQLVLPLPADASEAEIARQMDAAQQLSQSAKNCAELAATSRSANSPLSGSVGTVDVTQLPPDVRKVVLPLKVNDVSQPFRTGNGIVVLMVCDRQEQEPDANIRSVIERSLQEQRMSAAAQRHLRNLRRQAFVDVRL